MNTDIYIPQADLTGFCNVWVPYSSRALDFRRLWRAEHGLLYYSPTWVHVWVWFTGINLSNKEQNLSSSSCHSKPKWFSGTEKKIFCRMFKLLFPQDPQTNNFMILLKTQAVGPCLNLCTAFPGLFQVL